MYDASVKSCKLYKTLLARHISKSIEFSSEEKMGLQQVDRDENRVMPRSGGSSVVVVVAGALVCPWR